MIQVIGKSVQHLRFLYVAK